MTPFDYITDIALIVVVARQMRTRSLTLRSLLLPLGLVATAGISYLRPVSLGGNNLTLIAVLTAAGIALGSLSGLATAVWCQADSGQVYSRAGMAAAVLWVAGMGARFAFAVYATHSGLATLANFSVRHAIIGPHIWESALVLMAYGEVLSRLGVLQWRRIRLQHHTTAARPAPAETTLLSFPAA